MTRPEPADAAAAKAQLRTRIRAGRRARRDRCTPAERAAAGEGIARGAVDLAARWGLRPGVAAAYESRAVEPPTERLVRTLAGDGWQVLVPITLPDLDLSWGEAGQDADLGVDAIGRAGLVLVPATAVDPAGHRLGQGGGSYDRALARLAPGTRVAAVLWDDELLDRVPSEPHDRRVDAVLTPTRVIEVGGRLPD